MPVRQRMKQIPSGKQCETEGSTPEIEVMSNAGFEPKSLLFLQLANLGSDLAPQFFVSDLTDQILDLRY